jgi:hypothetical protein
VHAPHGSPPWESVSAEISAIRSVDMTAAPPGWGAAEPLHTRRAAFHRGALHFSRQCNRQRSALSQTPARNPARRRAAIKTCNTVKERVHTKLHSRWCSMPQNPPCPPLEKGGNPTGAPKLHPPFLKGGRGDFERNSVSGAFLSSRVLYKSIIRE